MSSIKILATLAAALLLIFASRSPAHAVTCDDVRSLTAAEQAYWSKRLNLSREQKDQIRRACNLPIRRATFRSSTPQAER
jgi:hypothetical protein